MADTLEAKTKQLSGGDWFKDDGISSPQEEKVACPRPVSPRPINTPLPGLRDDDVDFTTIPSARHQIKEGYSDYVKLAKQGGHSGLLKLEGKEAPTSEEMPIKKNVIRDDDPEYVKLAKSGGHSDLLKIEGRTPETHARTVAKDDDSEYVRLAKSGGHSDLLKINGRQQETMKKNAINEKDSEYIKLAKSGGHQGLLKMESPDNAIHKKNVIKADDPAYIKLAKSGGHANLLSMEGEPETSPKKHPIRDSDAEYVKLSKQGGHAKPRNLHTGKQDLLHIEEHKKSDNAVQYKKTGGDWFSHDGVATDKNKNVTRTPESNNNITRPAILPSGPEIDGAKTGKKYFQRNQRAGPAPFALFD